MTHEAYKKKAHMYDRCRGMRLNVLDVQRGVHVFGWLGLVDSKVR